MQPSKLCFQIYSYHFSLFLFSTLIPCQHYQHLYQVLKPKSFLVSSFRDIAIELLSQRYIQVLTSLNTNNTSQSMECSVVYNYSQSSWYFDVIYVIFDVTTYFDVICTFLVIYINYYFIFQKQLNCRNYKKAPYSMAGKIKPEIKHIIYKNGNEKGKKNCNVCHISSISNCHLKNFLHA